MRTSLLLSVLLGAGAIAHPHYKLNNPLAHHHQNKRQDPIVATEYLKNAQGQVTEVLDIAKAMVTVYAGGPPPPSPVPVVQPVEAAAKVNVKADYHVGGQANSYSYGNEQAAPQYQPHEEPESPSNPAPAPAPEPAPAPVPAPVPAPIKAQVAPAPAPAPVKEEPASPPSSGGSGATIGGQNVLDVANKWRSKQGLGTFTWDNDLATMAANTNIANGANTMTHHRAPPSLGEVITEGSNSLKGPSSQGQLGPIDLMWLGWICELSGNIPTFPCSDATAATHMNTTETIHAEILMNQQYNKLGCHYMDATDPGSQVWPNVYQGMFTCDVS